MPPLYLHMGDETYEPVDVVPPVDPPIERITGWRFLHRSEGGRWNPDDMPEIRNATEDVVTEMTKEVQLLAWGVMKALNPDLIDKKYPALHTDHTAMNNTKKFGYNNDPDFQHTDWINQDAKYNSGLTNTSYDKTRGYGGQLIQAYDEGEYLRVVPNVHCIDPSNLPTVQRVLEKRWYSLAVNVNKNGTVSDFAQGNINESYGVIAYLWISKKEVLFPKSWFQWWDETYYPDHLKMYVQPSFLSTFTNAARNFIGI